ncbi:allantoate amidohydrolase [Nesterenkonia sp. MY13]|uniref:Allantoate amidohydrolase n=1 Tax=Nesterenkonia sedimenti TaxID=1463632 RepID=A0A7X8THG7_9MICC|nr:allantoate amidohydrolase [Nesterenkonia sedimenti]NLS08611.1 allantoate amidohydrolase [Nesterenkonia sedimenti]
MTVNSLMQAIADIGADPIRGGYSRPVYSDADLTLREWFISEAQTRGLDVETDHNGIIWAWWDRQASAGESVEATRRNSVVTGSHLDSVPGGGAFDGPLGVASALAALDELKAREQSGALKRRRCLAITVFPEEEGSRFGVACLGSRLMTGAITREKALNLRDSEGLSFGEVAADHGLTPDLIGEDPARLSTIGAFVELHVEQGRGINTPEYTAADGKQPAVAVGNTILGHGRWRLSVTGQGNHAGTTLMDDRADPMVAAAEITLATRNTAREHPGARATVGRLQPIPGGTNVIASRVDLWLDVRHPQDEVTATVVEKIYSRAKDCALAHGCQVEMVEESYSGTVHFSPELSSQLEAAVRRTVPDAPILPTGAGHDAGVLAAHVPSGMIYVRNPTGISHAPEESVENDDADQGVQALADALSGLLEAER